MTLHPPTGSAESILIRAFQEGRPIIPFLGAGISISTGYPPIAEIAGYLAKVRHYIDYIRPQLRRPKDRRGAYADYIQARGWPDLNQLNADLWRHVTRVATSESAWSNVKEILGAIDSSANFEVLRRRWEERVNFRPQQVIDAEHLRAMSEKDSKLASRVLSEIACDPDTCEMRSRGDWYDLMMTLSEGNFDLVDALFASLARGKTHGTTHVLLSKLINFLGINRILTLNFDPFLEEAMRAEGHIPTVINTSRDADIPSTVVVTDDLTVVKLHGSAYGVRIGEKIQMSLDNENRVRALDLIPQNALVLVMGFSGAERRMLQLLEDVARRGAGDCPSILWMHWLERPDYAVDLLKKNLDEHGGRVVPKRYSSVDGFLLRVLCLLRGEFPATKSPYRALPTRCVVWSPGKARDPATVKAPAEGPADAPGAATPRSDATREPDVFESPHRIRVYLDDNFLIAPDGSEKIYDPSLDMIKFASSLEERGYRILWIDCEEHHTTEGVVADVIDQIRSLDPLFPPYLMRTGESLGQEWKSGKIVKLVQTREMADTKQFERAVERIREALQRGRYVLCFDSPEMIARPQTVHHGLPSFLQANRARGGTLTKPILRKLEHRIRRFFKFLRMLLLEDLDRNAGETLPASDIGESYIAVALCSPGPRHPRRTKQENAVFRICRDQVDGLKSQLRKAIQSTAFVSGSNLDPARQPELWVSKPARSELNTIETLKSLLGRGTAFKLDRDSVRVLTAVFRRPRSYLGVRSLLTQAGRVAVEIPQPDGGGGTRPASGLTAQEFLDLFGINSSDNASSYARFTAEGLIWLNRHVRAEAYETLSEAPRQWFDLAWSKLDLGAIDSPSDEAIRNLLLLSILHRRAARYYFTEVYSASHDLDAFREYIYHRVSFLRYMARLNFVAIHYEDETSRVLDEVGIDKSDADILKYLGPPLADLFRAGFAESLLKCRLGELQAFRATLSRESYNVLTRLNANTWISWLERLISEECEWLQEDVLLEKAIQSAQPPANGAKRRGSPRTGSRGEAGSSRSAGHPVRLGFPGLAEKFEKEIEDLKNELQHQEIRFLGEKADWGNALQSCSNLIVNQIRFLSSEEAHKELWSLHFPSEERFSRDLQGFGETNKPKPRLWKELKRLVNSAPELTTESVLGDKLRELHKPTGDEGPGKITPPIYVTWHLAALDLANRLLEASSFAHHLAIAETGVDRVPDGVGGLDLAEPRRTEQSLLKIVKWILNGLDWGQQVVSSLKQPDKKNYYSRTILDLMKSKYNKLVLEHALRSAIVSFEFVHPWFDRKRKRVRGCMLLDKQDSTNKHLLKRARDHADHLFELARQYVFEDRAEYNRFHALALMFRARSTFLADGDDMEGALSSLDKASNLLDASVGVGSPIDRVSILRTRVECLMLDADFKVGKISSMILEKKRLEPEKEPWLEWEKCWSFAERRLMQARKTLSEAYRIYRLRRRNVNWWLRLSRDYTQWCIESSVLNICGDPIWKHRRKVDRTRVTRYDVTFDLGVSAVRAGLNALSWSTTADVVDEVEAAATLAELNRSVGQWLCLMVCAWFRSLIDEIDETQSDWYPDLQAYFEAFWTEWSKLNEVHRMPRLVSDEMKTAVGECLLGLPELLPCLRGIYASRHHMKILNITSIEKYEKSRSELRIDPDPWVHLRGALLMAMDTAIRSQKVRDEIATALQPRTD